ncbi:hypothetical protein [Tenacibaculum ascidiaceicola]|uniref:hypothetical protein n=1 Tax=Tenacibaculum ascidiaceicola TaxID=1699411 RepID=UPI003895944F
MNKINNFWNWFSTNEENLSPEKITNELISELDNKILSLGDFSWEIREGKNKSNLLVISPGGDVDLLKNSLEIIKESPDSSNWEFLHYKPAKDWDFKLSLYNNKGDEEIIDVKDWEYVLLRFEDSTYDIIFKTNSSKTAKRDDINLIGDIVLESILGEELSLNLIKNIDFVNEFDKKYIEQKTSITNLRKHFFKLENIEA